MTSHDYYYNMLPEAERDFFRYMPTVNELVAFAQQNYADDVALDGIAGPITYRALCDKLVGIFIKYASQSRSYLALWLLRSSFRRLRSFFCRRCERDGKRTLLEYKTLPNDQ